jgi:hypothetical protein
VGARRDQSELQLEWVVDGERARSVTVRVHAYGARRALEFPHFQNEGGETLGREEWDAAVRHRAEQLVAFLDATEVWRGFTSSEREGA